MGTNKSTAILLYIDQIEEIVRDIVNYPDVVKDIVTRDNEFYFRIGKDVFSVNKEDSATTSPEIHNVFRYSWSRSVAELVALCSADEKDIERQMIADYGDNSYKNKLFKRVFELIKDKAEGRDSTMETGSTMRAEMKTELAPSNKSIFKNRSDHIYPVKMVNDYVGTGVKYETWFSETDRRIELLSKNPEVLVEIVKASDDEYYFLFYESIYSVNRSDSTSVSKEMFNFFRYPWWKGSIKELIKAIDVNEQEAFAVSHMEAVYGDTDTKNEENRRLFEFIKGRAGQ